MPTFDTVSADRPTCANCRYWLKGKTLMNGVELAGHCHRFPPTVNLGTFPMAEETDWCGEHSLVKSALDGNKAGTPRPPQGGPAALNTGEAHELAASRLQPDKAETGTLAGFPSQAAPARPKSRRQ